MTVVYLFLQSFYSEQSQCQKPLKQPGKMALNQSEHLLDMRHNDQMAVKQEA